MSYDIFLKELGSQESGYSGNKPNIRGKYILIPKKFYSIFPYLSKTTLNDQSVMRCKILGGSEIAINIVYNNAKYFPHMSRDHNEVRIYRNTNLDKVLGLDRGVIVIVAKLGDGSFGFVSVQKNSLNYNFLKDTASKKNLTIKEIYNTIKNLDEVEQLISLDSRPFSGDILNSEEAIKTYTERLVKTRKQQTEYINFDDPAKPLESLINSQDTFKKYIRTMYGGRCALRGSSLVQDNFVGLEAAHIHPHSHEGPLLPTNGILLSKDLHAAFEDGFFTLDVENKVMVSNKVKKESILWGFHKKIITPVDEYKIYEPFNSYTQWHRDVIFERKFQ